MRRLSGQLHHSRKCMVQRRRRFSPLVAGFLVGFVALICRNLRIGSVEDHSSSLTFLSGAGRGFQSRSLRADWRSSRIGMHGMGETLGEVFQKLMGVSEKEDAKAETPQAPAAEAAKSEKEPKKPKQAPKRVSQMRDRKQAGLRANKRQLFRDRFNVSLTLPASYNWADGVDVSMKGLRMSSVNMSSGQLTINGLGQTSKSIRNSSTLPAIRISQYGNSKKNTDEFEVAFSGMEISLKAGSSNTVIVKPVYQEIMAFEGVAVNVTVTRINDAGVWVRIGSDDEGARWKRWTSKLMVPVKYMSRIKWEANYKNLKIGKIKPDLRRLTVEAEDWDALLGSKPEWRMSVNDLKVGDRVRGYKMYAYEDEKRNKGKYTKVDIGCDKAAEVDRNQARKASASGNVGSPWDLTVKALRKRDDGETVVEVEIADKA